MIPAPCSAQLRVNDGHGTPCLSMGLPERLCGANVTLLRDRHREPLSKQNARSGSILASIPKLMEPAQPKLHMDSRYHKSRLESSRGERS